MVSSSQLAIDNSDTTVFRLIFLSRIEEKKGLELLFDALSLLDINWQLSIAGSGKEGYVESLKLKAENLKLNPRINWIGQVTDQDKYNLIAKHDLLVLTSFNENFANVVIESLSVGTPVLISDRVGLSDYVREQQLGWVCTLEVSDIKEKLINAYHAQKVREKMKQAAPEVIRRDFNDKALAKRYLELYRRLA
nr:glycosyltransferase [Pedobacter sp. SG908]